MHMMCVQPADNLHHFSCNKIKNIQLIPPVFGAETLGLENRGVRQVYKFGIARKVFAKAKGPLAYSTRSVSLVDMIHLGGLRTLCL